MKAYATGDVVAYRGDFGSEAAHHHGVVTFAEDDAGGDQAVTVRFDCGLTQVVLGSELQPEQEEEH